MSLPTRAPERPGLGTLLRHLIDLLDSDVEHTYRSAGLDYRPRYTPVMRALADGAPRAIRDLAAAGHMTHSAASQTVAHMEKKGLVARRPGVDGRERAVQLTKKARALHEKLQPHWQATADAAKGLDAELPVPLGDVLEAAIAALERDPFRARIARASRSARHLVPAVALVVAVARSTAAAPVAEPLDALTRQAVITAVATELERGYVFPDVGVAAAGRLRQDLERGAYDSLTDAGLFAARVTEDLRSASGDGHLGLEHSAKPLGASPGQAEEFSALEMERYYGAHLNFGVQRVERLEGNIGYLDLRVFAPVAMGGDAAAAAMQVLAATDALIIDLRNNGGGDGDLIKVIAAYLFDQTPRPLSGYFDRPANRTTQAFTQPYVPGRRFGPDKPAYILISKKTFSAAEAFAYDLQALRRAVVVGERSGGGAHPFEYRVVHPHYVLSFVTGRSVNPITGTNWQGAGVAPDVAVPADTALDTALRLAREALAARPGRR